MCKGHISYVLTYPSNLHVYIWVLDCVCLEREKNMKNILQHEKCLGWLENSVKTEKPFPLTVKYQGLKCKIVYTSISPSNHLHLFSASTQTHQ